MNLSKKFFILFLILVCIAPIRVGASSILTLKEAINKGLENDLQLIASRKRIQELENELSTGDPFFNWNWDVTVKTADLTYTPTKGAEISPFTAVLSGGAKLGDYVSIRGSLTRPREESKVPESLTLSYSRQIFSNPAYSDKSLNALKGEIELAKAEIDYESKVADVTLQIVKEYLKYLSLKEDFEKTKENLERVELMDKEVSIKYDLGYASTLDMLSSQLMLKEAEVSFNGSQASYEKQIAGFLKSLKIDEDFQLEDIRDSIDIEINLTPEELIGIAISNSGELEKLKLDIMYEHIQLNKIKTKDRPIIKVEGSYDPIRGDAGIFITGTYSMDNSKPLEKEIKNKSEVIDSLNQKEEEIKTKIAETIERLFGELEEIYIKSDLSQLKIEKSDIELAAAKERFNHGLISEIAMEQAFQSHDKVLRAENDLKLSAEMKKLEILNAAGIDILSAIFR